MNAKWIWNTSAPSENLFVIARTRFHARADMPAELLVSADSDFAAFLNGAFLGRGQFSDFPDAKTYTRIPLKHVQDENLLEIRVYFCGSNFLNHLKGTPRLWAEVRQGNELLTASSGDWEIAEDAAFRSGAIEKLNGMLGYTWEYDARRQPGPFEPARELDFTDVPRERPVPMILPGNPLPIQVVWHGYFKRREPKAFPGAAMGSDMVVSEISAFEGTFQELPPDADGWVLINDLGREVAGLLHFQVDASAGTVLDIAHGEHLELGRVLCTSQDRKRTYGDRYICKEGRNEFTFLFRRYGTRYLEMHISNARGPVKVHSFTLMPTDLELPEPASFVSEDRLLVASHRIGVRTLELCMHEHYEDCPWREQSLYGYDSRNQMLFGYYAYGNYAFADASLRLLGDSMLQNGFLNLTAPGDLHIYIPVFTFAWLAALYEHHLYSGSKAPYLHHREKILDAVRRFIAAPTPEGLFLPPPSLPESKTWNFCEWVDGLDGDKTDDAPVPTAFHNLYLVEALQAVGHLEGDQAFLQTAENLGRRTEATFWREEEGCYATRPGDSRRHSHIQYLMLALGLVPAERRERVIANARSPKMIASTFSSYIYMIRAMALCNRIPELDKQLRDVFDSMTLSGATSFWEVPGGANGFAGTYGGSLCHGWSCSGLYFDGAFRLGVIPTEPGFKTFSLNIHPCGLTSLSGDVPTPYGPIHVRWKAKEDGTIEAKLQYPDAIRLGEVAENIRLL